MPDIPPFILEPIEGADGETESRLRLRNDSYLGAVHKDYFLVRAGLQVKINYMTESLTLFTMMLTFAKTS